MKNFKELRSQLNEDEHTATGKANRSAYTNDVIANLAGERSLNNLNAMLATIARSTFLDPIDAYNKIRVRLNIALLDFTWREVQGKTEVGQYTIPVFVRGVEGTLFLDVNVSLNADSLYVVDARLQTAADIENETLPAIEEEVEQIDETSEASKQAKAKAEGHMIRLYGKGRVTHSSHSGGHFVEHESTDGSMTGETHGHTFHPVTGKISKTPHVTSSYYESTTNEEVEQIDELSPALLGRYIKKAGYSASDAANRAGQMRGAGNGKKSAAENNLYKKVIKREKGIGKAVDRLTGGY